MSKPQPDKPRVMQIITRLIRGGAQEVTVLIVQRLLRENYSVVLAHGPGDESLLQLLPRDNPNLELLFVPEFRRRILPFYDFLAFWRLFRYMKSHRVDLVHTHTSKAGIIGRWAAHFAGVPTIIHSPRGSIYHETYFNGGVLAFFAALERLTAKWTYKIVTLCESEKKDYIRHNIAKPEKFTTIYSGVEIKRYVDKQVNKEQKKKQLGLPFNRPLIGYVARMTPEKGHEMCLRAFTRVLKEVPEAFLVLVGGGPLEDEIQSKIISMKLQKDVLITGMRSDVEEIMPIFDCVVQTSLWDGLPRAMVEAMVAERAVVATSVGGIPEVIHHQKTGILVPEKDEEAIAKELISLLRTPEKAKQLGKNARKRMEEVFDVDASVEKLFALYEACLLKNSPAKHV